MREFEREFERWVSADVLTEDERQELKSIKGCEDVKELRFGSIMSFGTAGLRSTMNLGPACMNRFTVAQTTRGIAALIKAAGGIASLADAEDFINLGAKRLGTSRVVKIAKNEKSTTNY